MNKIIKKVITVGRAITLLVGLHSIFSPTMDCKETIAWFAMSIILTVELRYFNLKDQ